jgi:putative ABC transport system permease protein
MKEGARGSSALGKSLRRGLVVVEMALAVVLLIGAGLMLRSFDQMRRVDLGFAPERLLTGRVVLWGEKYQPQASRVDFFQQLIARTKADPAVEGVAGIGTVFLSATPNSTNFSIEGRPDFAPEEAVEVPLDSITPDYFRVMGVKLLEGRFFDERDATTAPPTVIINKRMADMFWPKGDALGRRMKYGNLASQGPWITIVGIVADTRRTGYDAVVRPETYLPHAQSTDSGLMMVVRTKGDPEGFVPSLRAIVKQVDPGIAVQGAQPIESQLGDMTAQRRLNTLLLSLFGIVAAILAAVGIYGVISYSVQQRTRELGVRIALGAPGGRILRLVGMEVVPLAVAGLVLGLGAAFALGRSMTSMLYQVSATDPATFASICIVAFAIALLASLIPALRAVRLDPIKALRIE